MKKGRIRIGMVGGGPTSSIGSSHRMAIRMVRGCRLTTGVFDIDPQVNREFLQSINISEERRYSDYKEMIQKEKLRSDCIDVAVVATPNHTHYEIIKEFLLNDIAVISEKPLCNFVHQAIELKELAQQRRLAAAVMYCYSGYTMIKQARKMIAAGELGEIYNVISEFAHGKLALPLEKTSPSVQWRVDNSIPGNTFVLGDLATHIVHLASFVLGQKIEKLCCDNHCFVKGRKLEDNSHILLNFDKGAKGLFWVSAMATGQSSGMTLKVFGSKGSIKWEQQFPDILYHTPIGNHTHILERGASSLYKEDFFPMEIGLPQGYLGAFSNIYHDMISTIKNGRTTSDTLPNFEDGLEGVRFVEAASLSAREKQWVTIKR